MYTFLHTYLRHIAKIGCFSHSSHGCMYRGFIKVICFTLRIHISSLQDAVRHQKVMGKIV